MCGGILIFNRCSFKVVVHVGGLILVTIALWGKHFVFSSDSDSRAQGWGWGIFVAFSRLIVYLYVCICVHNTFKKINPNSIVYSTKDNKASARTCRFKLMSSIFLLKRKRLKVAPQHLLKNLKCTVTIYLSRSSAWGQVLLKLKRDSFIKHFDPCYWWYLGEAMRIFYLLS